MGDEPLQSDSNFVTEVAFTDFSNFRLPPCLNVSFSIKIMTFTEAIRLVFVTFAIITF